MDCLELFAENNLLKGIRDRWDEALNFIKDAHTRINEAKEFHLMSEKEVRIHKLLDELFITRNSTNFADFAKKMINTQQELDQL